VLLFVLGVTAVLAVGIEQLSISASYRTFFQSDDPGLLQLDAIRDEFAKDDDISIVLVTSGGSVFSESMIQLQQAVTDAGWKVANTQRVDSLTN